MSFELIGSATNAPDRCGQHCVWEFLEKNRKVMLCFVTIYKKEIPEKEMDKSSYRGRYDEKIFYKEIFNITRYSNFFEV